MYTLRAKRTRLAHFVVCIALLGFAGVAHAAGRKTTSRRNAAQGGNGQSRITGVTVSGSQVVGAFGGVTYRRTWGIVSGVLTPHDPIRGFENLARDGDGNYFYQSEFEVVAPEKPGTNSVIVVEAENRGSPVFFNQVHEASVSGSPSANAGGGGVGNGFLFAHGTSYARVQWQTGIAKSVPANAEGVGEVIIRDFGRMLAGRSKLDANATPDFGTYRTLILGGISQSGFFVDTFLAEGFNADPEDGGAVYQGAIAVDGAGNWLALNELAAQAGSKQFPYVVPDGKPLRASEILGGHASDPFYIDIANYTDFYRLRASFTDAEPKNPRIRRYDWPSAHAPMPIDQSGGSARAGRCNGGAIVDLNPIPHAAYLRAVTLGLERELGVPSAKQATPLPPSVLFTLTPADSSTPNFNALPGVRLSVPLTDDDDWPLGGVRFADAEHPVGRPAPPSIPPVVTTSVDATCGNLGGWQQFSPEELAKRYGGEANYVKLYAASVDKLISAGYLLSSDREEQLKNAAALYARRPVGAQSASAKQ